MRWGLTVLLSEGVRDEVGNKDAPAFKTTDCLLLILITNDENMTLRRYMT